MFLHHRRMMGVFYLLMDAILALASFALAHAVRARLPFLRPLYPAVYYLWIVPLALGIWIAVGLAAGIYRDVEEDDLRRALADPAKVFVIATTLLFAFTFALKVGYVSRALLGLYALFDLLGMILFRLAVRPLGSRLRRAFAGMRHFLVVGTTAEAMEIARTIEAHERHGMKLAGLAVPRAEDLPEAQARMLGGLEGRYPIYLLDQLRDLLHRRVIDEVVFAVGKPELDFLKPAFLVCEEEGVRTRLLLSFFPHTFSKVSLDRLQGMPLLTFSTTPENEYLLLLKRLVDFIMALVLLVLFAPLMLLLALLIKLTSAGPVLYRQTRCGLGGRRFTVYKFRSMHADADLLREELAALNELDGPVFKIKNDPRCTGVGRFMRKFSLDELPQLFNILKGDMSFVGPRPPLPEEVERYEPWQRRRLRMQPGLTCLWALEGRSTLSFRRWMELDLQYIDHWSPALDWKILLKTIPVVLTGRGAS